MDVRYLSRHRFRQRPREVSSRSRHVRHRGIARGSTAVQSTLCTRRDNNLLTRTCRLKKEGPKTRWQGRIREPVSVMNANFFRELPDYGGGSVKKEKRKTGRVAWGESRQVDNAGLSSWREYISRSLAEHVSKQDSRFSCRIWDLRQGWLWVTKGLSIKYNIFHENVLYSFHWIHPKEMFVCVAREILR